MSGRHAASAALECAPEHAGTLAAAARDLASPDSSFLLGTEIIADGGVIGLKLADAAVSQEPALRAEAA